MALIRSVDVGAFSVLENFHSMSPFPCVGRIGSNVVSLFGLFFCIILRSFFLLFMFFICSFGWSDLACFLLIFVQFSPILHAILPMNSITIIHLLQSEECDTE